ncbi:MAG: A24 family peptidase [Vicinamibacterales bacterium]|jgi:leader peptidase (prepilin peptidase)/N-methyltransferase|nr:A24 family peptidase [Vicinamibacterales bacterium]
MTGPISVGLVAALGLAIGSFLNVCIYRLPRGESVVSPSSRCPSCGRGLRWFENVPVVGYVLLGGRCRTCRAAVSPMYPVVEGATAVVFLLQYGQLGWQPLLGVRLLFAAAMIVLFVIDLQHRILPNVITLPGVVVGVAASFFFDPGWRASLIGVAAGGGVLWAVAEAYFRLRGEEGMGMGDVKMLAMIGAFLGWQPMLVTLMIASLSGSLVGVGMMLAQRGGMKYALPLGSFLAAGALIATHVGQPLVEWYVGFY